MSEFHLLRPWWLLAAIPATLLAWRLWTSEKTGLAWRGVIAPHLLPHLLTGHEERSMFRPATVIPVAWLLAVVALAGPTWRREPAPFAEDRAALAIVLKVTPSMLSRDVQPTRLARATEKIHDLLEQRPGTKTALFAYAGSVHRVMPLTSDAGIIDSFASDLTPEVMPVEGSRAGDALDVADAMIKGSGQSGWILWIADAASSGELKSIEDAPHEDRVPVTLLAVAGDGPEMESLERGASGIGASVVPVTPDDSDIRRIARTTRYSAVADASGGDRWEDSGYWLVAPVALISLLWFRRGWMFRSVGGAA